MKTLSYSPNMEVYVAARGKDRISYYDLTEDIVSGQVTRNQDASSTFSVTIANKHGKYNGVFTPMDRVIIYLSKTQRFQVLSGYITTVSAWTLYPQDFKMSGYCSLYRLQRLYWDPGLVASYDDFFSNAAWGSSEWAGYGDQVRNMLVKVGGYNESDVSIGDMPQSVVDWAYGLYAAKIEDMEQARDLAGQFYDMLASAGPQISGSGRLGMTSLQGSAAQKAVVKLYTSWIGMFTYSQAGGRLDPVHTGYGDCSSTCYRAYMDAANVDCGTWTGDMVTKGREVASGSGSNLPLDRMEPADLVLFNWYGTNPSFDHVEMYIGENQFAGHGGPGKGPTIKPDAKAYAGSAFNWQVRRYID